MKTSNEMIEFVDRNKFGTHVNADWKKAHFSRIEESLQEQEEVEVAFVALHNFKKTSKHEGLCAYALTNKRMLISQLNQEGEKFQFINFNDIKNITMNKGFLLSAINIITVDDIVLRVGYKSRIAANVFANLEQAFNKLKNN